MSSTCMPMEHTLTRSHSCTTHTYIIHHCCHHLHPHHHHLTHTHTISRGHVTSNEEKALPITGSLYQHRSPTHESGPTGSSNVAQLPISTIGDVKPVSALLSALGVSSAKPLR